MGLVLQFNVKAVMLLGNQERLVVPKCPAPMVQRCFALGIVAMAPLNSTIAQRGFCLGAMVNGPLNRPRQVINLISIS